MNPRHDGPPPGVGERGARTLIQDGAVLSMQTRTGDFPRADVLLEGDRILAVGPQLEAGDATKIDARGMVVMPGFVDTHHHQFQTALRGMLADALLLHDGKPHGELDYFDCILGKLAPVYRPEDVYIGELVGSLSQLDAGVTTVMDVSQIHHTPEHTDAAIEGLQAAGRRSMLAYFEGTGSRTGYPADVRRVKQRYCSSKDQLLTLAMGGEIFLPDYQKAWQIARELDVPIGLHVVASVGSAAPFEQLIREKQLGPDNVLFHMTGMSDAAWRATADGGCHVSIAVPSEMSMRHGCPPIQQALNYGIQPALSSDVECTITADFFTQMRCALLLQRYLINEAALRGTADLPELLTCRDVVRFATVEGAKCLHLERQIGALAPGMKADLLLLDARALNVAPLNHAPGAVVTLMDRSNVAAVFVDGRIRKWSGKLLHAQLDELLRKLEDSRDYLLQKAGIAPDLFRV